MLLSARSTLAVLTALIALVDPSVPAQGPVVGADQSASFGLMVSHDRGEAGYYLVGEPVLLALNLTSFTPWILNVSTDPSIEADLVLSVTSSLTARTPVLPPFPSLKAPRKPVEVLPFETRRFTLSLLYDRAEKALLSRRSQGKEELISWPLLVFDHEDTYRVDVDLDVQIGGGGKVNITSFAFVQVRSPPPGSAEDLILGRLTTNRAVMEAYQRGNAGPKTRGFFQRALRDFPRSRYSPYFLLSLAKGYAVNSDGDIDVAIEYYNQLLREHPYFPMAHRAMVELASILHSLDRSDEAFQLVEQLRRENPAVLQQARDTRLMEASPLADNMPLLPEFWMLAP
jgi:tetratricopeptide (TPR) repeat protein